MILGVIRSELAAILWGSIMLAAEAYSFVATLFALTIRRSDTRGYVCRIMPRECKQGEKIIASTRGIVRFRPPLVLVRYQIALSTFDGRQTDISFDPERSGSAEFYAGERGAYGAPSDKLCVFDALGFFHSEYLISADQGPRLSVRPAPATSALDASQLSGGAELRIEKSFRRTEDLTDNRRYTPGDDPRRINWKIFGHAGELFVREGEPEPPPRSRFVVLVDASVDPELFDAAAGRFAVDFLVEQALGLVNSVLAAGFEPRFGFNGSEILSGDARTAATAFALPAAVGLERAADLPRLSQSDRGALLLALPRKIGIGNRTALDRFIRDSTQVTNTNLFFIIPILPGQVRIPLLRRFLFRPHKESKLLRGTRGPLAQEAIENAVAACITAYNGRGGVHARRAEA